MAIFQKRSPANPFAAKQPPPPVKPPQPVAPPAPPPQFLRDIEVRTQIAADAVINGKLSFTTPTRVEGKLKGELRCTGLLVVGPKAVVEGWIKADEVQIEGIVRGEIVETRKVEIGPRGRFFGKLSAQLLSIRDGGFVDAECTVGPDVPLCEQRPRQIEVAGEEPMVRPGKLPVTHGSREDEVNDRAPSPLARRSKRPGGDAETSPSSRLARPPGERE